MWWEDLPRPGRLVLVIGLGNMGMRRSRILLDGGHRVLGLDLREVSFSYGPRVGSIAEGVAIEPDRVMICTPPNNHLAVLQELQACGYRGPVFVEKPIVSSIAELDSMESLSFRSVCVGGNWLHSELIYNLRTVLWDAETISLESLCATESWPAATYQRNSTFNEIGTHAMYILEFLGRSKIESITCFYQTHGEAGEWDPARAYFQGKFKNGKDLQLTIVTYSGVDSMQVVGTGEKLGRVSIGFETATYGRRSLVNETLAFALRAECSVKMEDAVRQYRMLWKAI